MKTTRRPTVTATPAPQVAHEADVDYLPHLGTLDATPDTTVRFEVGLFPEAVYDANDQSGWREWRATMEYHGPGSCLTLKVTQRRKYAGSDKAELETHIVNAHVESIEEAQYLGELILATVAKLRRTADAHRIPILR